MQPEVQALADGVRFIGITDGRFKTSRVTAALLLPLREDTASANALLPYLLRRGCAAYPDFTALNRRLNTLYGARILAEVTRVGECQALVLTAVSIDDRFALEGEDVAAQCAALLCSMLFEPALVNGLFRPEDVEQEKRCLSELIESEINEKRWYARRQAEKLLCGGEPYAVDYYGTLERVDALTPEETAAAWKKALTDARVQLCVQGCGSADGVAEAFRRGFAGRGQRQPAPYAVDTDFDPDAPLKTRTERMPVNQSKLVMGFRTTVTEPDGEVAALRLMNALWGGTPHSLLFRHVREKLGLCYYCQSSFDRHKGVLLVDSGVEEANAEQAEAEILRQLNALREGRFTDEELESARLSVVNQFRGVGDLQSSLSSWYLGQAGLNVLTDPEQAAAAVGAVTREQVQAAAATVRYAARYMLAAEKKNGEEGENADG